MSGLYPGDARALGDPGRLAEEKEWAVLAALVAVASRPEALGALAGAADEEAAFRWMWSVANPENPQHCQQLAAGLTAGIAIPSNLRDAVRNFVLAPTPHQAAAHQTYEQQVARAQAPRREAQVKLLANLDPRPEYARNLAQAVLDAEGNRYWPELQYAAFDVLGASRRKADRSYFFERVDGLAPRERLRPLLGLAPPYSREAQERISLALCEALPVSGPFFVGGARPETYWGSARELTARLSAQRIEEVLGAPWVQHETDRARFLDGGFVRGIGPEKLRVLLASGLDETVRRHLIRAASAELAVEAQADLGVWTHANLDPEWSQPVRDRLSAYARPSRYGPRSPQDERALEALRDFALACDDPRTAANFSSCLDPGEAPGLTEKAVASRPPPARVGRVAGELLRRDAEAFQGDVEAMVGLYPDDEDRATFLSGLLEAESGEEGQRLDLGFLGPKVLGQPESILVLARAGHDRAVAEAAVESDDPAGACLLMAEAAIEELGDDVVGFFVEELCGWTNLSLSDYRRYVTSLSRRPQLLFTEAASALESLSGPEADAVPAEHLEMLLAVTLGVRYEEGVADGEDKETPAQRLARAVASLTASLRLLLDHRSRALRRLALAWAEGLEPDGALVGLLVEKKASTRGLEEDFGRVLKVHAEELAARSGDAAADWRERTEALGLARLADEAVAREAAFGLCGSQSAELRRRAALVLAETEGQPGDEERLRRLLKDESDADAGALLDAALRKISSGSVERALENLKALVGLPPRAAAPDVRALLPDEGWDSRFVECVDRARRRRSGDPGAYVDALITLAELLVDVAVAERHYAAPENSPLGRKGASQAEAIRSNHRSKPDHGELIRRQNLTEEFPWFRQVAILREMRGAHPAPAGSTDPLRVGDDELAYAQRLFRDAVSGWESSMEETRGMAA